MVQRAVLLECDVVSPASVSNGQSPGPGDPSGLVRVELLVRGMTCAACAAKVESRLSAVENVSAPVNFATEKATVTAPLSVPVQLLVEEIERAGYGATPVRPSRYRRRPMVAASRPGA